MAKFRRFMTLAALFFYKCSADSVEEDDGDQYFGVPLGALHFSSDGTSAEIYAADEFTIIFNHFYHNPRRSGCTAMMIGPARKEDKENVVEGHGLLIAPAHPPVAARYRHRVRRNASLTRLQMIEQFTGWPVEFDHLLMAPESQLKDNKNDQPNESTSEPTTPQILETEQLQPLKMIVLAPPRLNSTLSFEKNDSTSTYTPLITTPIATLPANVSSSSTMALTNSKVTQSIIDDESTMSITEPSLEEHTQEPLPIIFFETKGAGKAKPIKVKSSLDSKVQITSSGETISFIRNDDISEERDFVRRAPARNDFFDHSKNGLFRTTTPLYYVIKDPRESRRQRLLALKRKLGAPLATTTTTATPELEKLKRDFDERFALPTIRDKLATFSLTNGAKINQYKWIGLYDQCLKRHIPLVSLRDVDPPREEKISPLSGWSHNITSYRVHVLNCNTILIPGFTFNPGNSTGNTYFFVGIGEFPNNIERQMKATLVGSRRDEPLHAYNGEDVLLRLPNGFRTFDIDFITIYNTVEEKSYAHVIIPSLLVPPCAED